MKNKFRVKKAFTLAEVLITFAVIGVIAAVIIPTIAISIQSKIRANQIKVAQQKFAKSIEQMALNNKIGPYYGTGADATRLFVDELTKFYKTDKICNSTNLVDCFGYKEVRFADLNEEPFDITTAKKGTIFKGGDGSNFGDEYNSDTVGLIGLDGTRFILTFKNNCKELEPKVFQYNADATWNEAMTCVSALIDIDGASGPNKLGQDVTLINAGSIGSNCPVKLGSNCFSLPFIAEPVTWNDCKDKFLSLTGSCTHTGRIADGYDHFDYYAGAAVACGGHTNMVNAQDFLDYASTTYEEFRDMTPDSAHGVQFYASHYKDGIAASSRLPLPAGSNKISVWIDIDDPEYLGRGENPNPEHEIKHLQYGDEYIIMPRISRETAGIYTMCKL